MWMMSATLGAMAGCRGSARLTGGRPNGSPRSVGRQHDCSMNADHADAMVLYCKAFSKATEITSASMTGVDMYGFDMSAMTPKGTTTRPSGVRHAGPHAGGSARRSDLDGEGCQSELG